MTAAALSGWTLALAAACYVARLRRRLQLVACAEHELRGPLAALTLAAARRRAVETSVIEGQLERARIALADLTEARRGRRAPARLERLDMGQLARRAASSWAGTGAQVTLDWRAGHAPVDADPARVSQALGNLLSNAVEHGDGNVVLRGVWRAGRLRVEVANRGRGLAIAARAVEDVGGRFGFTAAGDQVLASVELPAAEP
ncbi:MAG TPA: ATP-binding protein [Thermoleophilaceae bacterium]